MRKIIKKYGYSECKHAFTPHDPNVKLFQSIGDDIGQSNYASIIENLRYVTNHTKPIHCLCCGILSGRLLIALIWDIIFWCFLSNSIMQTTSTLRRLFYPRDIQLCRSTSTMFEQYRECYKESDILSDSAFFANIALVILQLLYNTVL